MKSSKVTLQLALLTLENCWKTRNYNVRATYADQKSF